MIMPSLTHVPPNEIGPVDGTKWLWDNGINIDFWSDLNPPGCGLGKRCANSVELCGICMRNTVPNNILFGFFARAHGVSELIAASGAQVINHATNGSREGCEQQSAYRIGMDLFDRMRRRGALFNESSICQAIEKSNYGRYTTERRIDCIKKPFNDCSLCGVEIPLSKISRIEVAGIPLPDFGTVDEPDYYVGTPW